MLSKCANPACSNIFLYFHEGKLFLLASRPAVAHRNRTSTGVDRPSCPQYAWLCSTCCRSLTIRIDKEIGALLVLESESPSDGLSQERGVLTGD